VVIGRVAAVRRNDGEPALVHWRSQFRRLS
jgi:hypothetical protein